MPKVLELRNVTKDYKQGRLNVQALRGVDLAVNKGEFIAILGPSGSGKSTLLNVVGCLDVPTTGQIILEGKDISNLSKKEQTVIRQKIGFVFQRFNLIQRLNVIENIEISLTIQAEVEKEKRHERCLQMLKMVGLSKRKEHRPKELSGGQQQRVAIARGLIRKPEYLLLDEPTGNVDTQTRDQIIKLILKLQKKSNITVIMITHDLKLAEIADRMLYLVDGKLVPKDVFEKPIELDAQ